MRLVTRLGLTALAFVLASGAASAQNDVTFQVDLNPYITTCQFDADNNTVTTPGDMNGWDNTAFALADDDSDGVYSGTYSLPEGDINYKFYVGGSTVIDWEADPNRMHTVVAGAQTIDVVTFNGPAVMDNCSAMTETYEITFTADMSVQVARGAFDPTC
ncbi:MAG: CBM20 domain-containing protein [Bacteroidota bacterium]